MSINISVIHKSLNKQISIDDLRALFSEIASKYNLIISSQIILNGHMFGVDGQHKKLLLLKPLKPDKYGWHLIDFDDVKSCSVKKTYKSIKAGEITKLTIENYLEKVALYFRFIRSKISIEIPFYLSDKDRLEELPEKEQKAKNWATILSKMLNQKTIL